MKKFQLPFRQLLTFTIVALLAMISVSTGNAQTSGVDPSFNTIPAKASASLGYSEIQPDGKILTFAFGGTRIFNGVPKNQIARLNADGSLDNSFDCAACDFNITSAVVQPDGKIIVAGAVIFTNSYGSAKIRRLNVDGSVDASFVSPFGEGNFSSSYSARVVEVQPDGKILVLIDAVIQGYHQDSIYRLNPDGSYDTSFTTIAFVAGRFTSQFVTQVRLQADGKILAGGFGGSIRYGFLYRFNSNGTNDTTFEPPTLGIGSSTTYIYDFDTQADGSVIFVGEFNKVNSVDRIAIAKLLSAGNVDLGFSQTNFFPAGSSVNKIKILSDGKILVSTMSRLLRFNADGSLDNTFNAPTNFTEISRWRVDAQGRILISVSIVENGATVYRTFRLNQNGSLDNTFNISVATVGTVSVLASQTDGKAIIGGDFNLVNNVSRSNLARVNADGSLDTTFNPGSGFDIAPTKIIVQADGKILVGGSFTVYNGTARTGIVRLNADGSLDGAFAPVIAGNAVVYAIALRSDGKIYIGGTFNVVNGQTRSGIALLNADGSLDSTFNPTIGGSGATIRSIAAQSDGKVLIGGAFSGVNGFNRANLVRFNSDGSFDNTFNAGTIAAVNQIEVQADGKYVVSNNSTLIRLNNAGTVDAAFQSPTFTSSQSIVINAFVLQPDGSIIVGGNFTTVNNTARANISRIKADGTLDLLFLPNGANGAVNALVRTTDGKVLTSGSFTMIGGVNRLAVARLTVSAVASVTPFDFDGDGRADVAVFRPSNGTWYLSPNPATNYGAVQFGIASDKLVPADYDGDGKTDVAVNRDGNWYIQRSQMGFIGIAFGLASDVPVPADYDGDGKADIAVFRPSNGTWYLNRSTLGYTAVVYGLGTDKPVPGDYNGDGKAEVAVYRPSNGTWYTSTDPATNYGATAFGVASDILIPADYDGDRKTDIAVFRPSNGVWYFLRSTAGFTSVAFGFGTDTPVPADYDGDGKADVSVVRNGIWYLNRSTNGFTSVAFGAGDDKPVPNVFVR